MSTPIDEIRSMADEAEFQALATIDICNWIGALARAIARDAEAGGGKDVPVLADLAKYFDDTGATSMTAAFDQFRAIAAIVSKSNGEAQQAAGGDL
ncbi:hypothetical protein QL104_07505 [Pseudomonas piscis]|uniref:Uncharacterized protein n=1 Tax=Pseudomonas piscis TaxID=2614538 RepID=A0ABY9NLC4_9PSED|nr:hypothetical protein [Pseudomonas piscis]WMN19244.1 hypothetical protein QL104_07505 [Pseudomonas piscis]